LILDKGCAADRTYILGDLSLEASKAHDMTLGTHNIFALVFINDVDTDLALRPIFIFPTKQFPFHMLLLSPLIPKTNNRIQNFKNPLSTAFLSI